MWGNGGCGVVCCSERGPGREGVWWTGRRRPSDWESRGCAYRSPSSPLPLSPFPSTSHHTGARRRRAPAARGEKQSVKSHEWLKRSRESQPHYGYKHLSASQPHGRRGSHDGDEHPQGSIDQLVVCIYGSEGEPLESFGFQVCIASDNDTAVWRGCFAAGGRITTIRPPSKGHVFDANAPSPFFTHTQPHTPHQQIPHSAALLHRLADVPPSASVAAQPSSSSAAAAVGLPRTAMDPYPAFRRVLLRLVVCDQQAELGPVPEGKECGGTVWVGERETRGV